MEIQTGSIVYSKAGRDKSNILLVLKVEDGYAYVADGIQRKVDKKKKKKRRFPHDTNVFCGKASGQNRTVLRHPP